VGGVQIKVRRNGPYKVTGPARVVDPAGNEITCPEGEGIALCRCGNSRAKPFCDTSHKRVGWVADELRR
jgi:CDGSH-type Zn-finger protein